MVLSTEAIVLEVMWDIIAGVVLELLVLYTGCGRAETNVAGGGVNSAWLLASLLEDIIRAVHRELDFSVLV